jgi:hypothetical protein
MFARHVCIYILPRPIRPLLPHNMLSSDSVSCMSFWAVAAARGAPAEPFDFFALPPRTSHVFSPSHMFHIMLVPFSDAYLYY